MNTLRRVLSPETATELVGQTVEPQGAWDEDGIWYDADTHEPILAYFPFPDRTLAALIRKEVLTINWSTTYRSGQGFRNRSRTFGMAPRKTIMSRDSCRPSRLVHEYPTLSSYLDRAAELLSAHIWADLPQIEAADREAVNAVLPEWRLGDDSTWTSGVINQTSTLPYHRDGANFRVWSAMPVFRRGTRGGYLHLPEYDIAIPCRDGWVVCFAGWQLVHGVTPITTVQRDGYRISVVYYSLAGMKDCFTYAMELARGQHTRTAREDTMLR